MNIELTSMADFYYRLSKDDRYKKLAVQAYKESHYSPYGYDGNYEAAIKWIEGWLERDKRDKIAGARSSNEEVIPTCAIMINFINRVMRNMDIFYKTEAIISTTNAGT